MNAFSHDGGLLSYVALMTQGPAAYAFYVLLGMSLSSWYQILSRLVAGLFRYWQRGRFLAQFMRVRGRAELGERLGDLPPGSYGRLTLAAWSCWQQIGTRANLERDAWLATSLEQQLEQERLQLESGLTWLACVAACAPFVGLFGTVWGIVHALQSITVSGQSTLDKVAGPVGEALVMTGFGLLVALPALLAYNLCLRSNRRELAGLSFFASRLYGLLAQELTLGHYPDSRAILPTSTKPMEQQA